MGLSQSATGLSLSAGLLIGLGLSGTSFSVILGAVGRAVPAEQRSMAMGISSAAGSFGQFAMLPGTLALIGWLGWSSALLALGLLVALIVPLAGLMKDRPLPPQGHEQSLGEALREACAHSGFWLLALGFFVCGFRWCSSAYTCRPTVDQHLPAQVGTTVLALVGLFNVFGTYIAGWLGGRWSKPRLLTALYPVRGVVIVLFLWLPLSVYSAYAFGVAMGAAVAVHGAPDQRHRGDPVRRAQPVDARRHRVPLPPVGRLPRRLAGRGGLRPHRQLRPVWQLSILLSLLAALLNWPVRERPVARLQVAGGAA